MIGADTRANNTSLINNTLSGLSQAGVTQFVSAGMSFADYPHGICSASMAFQLSYQTYDYTINFSASHNTAEYIGIKIFTRANKFIPTSVLKDLFTQAYTQYASQESQLLDTTQALALYKPLQ
jgi:phosphomannomutase